MATRGFGRAALSGLTMGWGDEAEAWLRSKLEGDLSPGYDKQLAEIRGEQAQYAKDNPFTSGAAEFVGGALPSVFVPGGQATGLKALARLVGTGAATGAVAGAGNATEGDRIYGATTGAVLGAGLGAAIPLAMRGVGAAASAVRHHAWPSDSTAKQIATDKMRAALERAGVSPQTIKASLGKDTTLGVPSMMLNTTEPLQRQAQMVVRRGRTGALELEKALEGQQYGSRERAYAQVEKNLNPGQYFADLDSHIASMRAKAQNAYDKAYSVGEVNDPTIMQYLQLPELKNAFHTARKIADADASAAITRGENPAKYALRDVYKATVDPQTKAMSFELQTVPDVRTLDYMKKALDAQINAGFRSDDAATLANSHAMKDIRNALRDKLKATVPAYKDALDQFAGDAQVRTAMETGFKDFAKLKPEEINKLVSGMSQGEKEAFRTGVSRHLYGQVMDPSGNVNAAQKLLGGPATRQKLAPLFDSPAHADLYTAALEREAQLFHTSSSIAGKSNAAEGAQMLADVEAPSALSQFLRQGAKHGFPWAISDAAYELANSKTMSNKVAGKLSEMLRETDPTKVATAVRLLEESAQTAKDKAVASRAREAATVMGTASAVYPSPTEGTLEAAAAPDPLGHLSEEQRAILAEVMGAQEKQGPDTQ